MDDKERKEIIKLDDNQEEIEVLNDDVKERPRDCKKKRRFSITRPINKLLFYIVLIIVLGLVFYSGFKFSKSYKTQEKTTKFGLEDVGELVTQTCYTTVLEDSKVNREFFGLFDIPFTESRQIFSYDFEVDASVKFDDINILKIDDENKVITIEVPRAQIYKTTIDIASQKVYLDQESLFSRINLDKNNEALQKMHEQAKADCIANKMLDKADSNAKVLITSIIRGNINYKEYRLDFVYKESE